MKELEGKFPICEDTAREFIDIFKSIEPKYGTNYGPMPKRRKPLPIEYPWVYERLANARSILKMNYWQMDWADARDTFRGLSKDKWEKKRKEMIQ